MQLERLSDVLVKTTSFFLAYLFVVRPFGLGLAQAVLLGRENEPLPTIRRLQIALDLLKFLQPAHLESLLLTKVFLHFISSIV